MIVVVGRRSIIKEPPKGSKLEHYVNALEGLANDGPPAWQSDDPVTREMGIATLLNEEPRIWMLPREIYRDYLFLPTIVEMYGELAAAALKRVPEMLDHYVGLVCDEARRLAKPRDRKPPEPKIEASVVMTVMAVYAETTQPGASNNAKYYRVGKRLGIERSAVRSIVKRVSGRLANADEDKKLEILVLIKRHQQLIREIDGDDARFVQNRGTRKSVAMNKLGPHH